MMQSGKKWRSFGGQNQPQQKVLSTHQHNAQPGHSKRPRFLTVSLHWCTCASKARKAQRGREQGSKEGIRSFMFFWRRCFFWIATDTFDCTSTGMCARTRTHTRTHTYKHTHNSQLTTEYLSKNTNNYTPQLYNVRHYVPKQLRQTRAQARQKRRKQGKQAKGVQKLTKSELSVLQVEITMSCDARKEGEVLRCEPATCKRVCGCSQLQNTGPACVNGVFWM